MEILVHDRRSDTKRNNSFLGDLADKISTNPGRPMRKLAVELGCSASTVSRSVSDLGLHSYSLKRGQFLTDSMKESRVVKASALVNNLKHERLDS